MSRRARNPAGAWSSCRRPDVQVPDGAASVFGAELSRATAYADLLATRGVEWGLIGPREVDRIWERHVLNSVAVGHEIGVGASVVDVGSGAGLPGIPVSLARPDLRVTLLEPLLRRANFLTSVVEELDLGDRVTVVRGRAVLPGDKDPLGHHGLYDVVTSRAVAPLARLVSWCAPLMAPEGAIVALKGSSAANEVTQVSADLARGGLRAHTVAVSTHEGADPTWVVVVRRGRR